MKLPFGLIHERLERLRRHRVHGVAEETLTQDLDGAKQMLRKLADAGIDMDAVTDQLLAEGVAKFATPFEDLLAQLRAKRASLQEN